MPNAYSINHKIIIKNAPTQISLLTRCLLVSIQMDSNSPVNTKHLYNIYTTSAQRLRHWPNYKCYTNALCLLGEILSLTYFRCYAIYDFKPGKMSLKLIKNRFMDIFSCHLKLELANLQTHLGSLDHLGAKSKGSICLLYK